jgi:hypothetical protein
MLTVDVAQAIAQEAMLKCRADGFKVTVRVVDHANLLRAFVRDDGASMGTIEVAQMKANSVKAFGRPSGPPPNLPAGAPVPPPLLPGTINAHGRDPDQNRRPTGRSRGGQWCAGRRQVADDNKPEGP